MNRREPKGQRAGFKTNLMPQVRLLFYILFSLISNTIISQDCTIPAEGFALICENPAYYTFTPDGNSPPEVTPCATTFNGNPITFDCEGSAYDPGNPPTVPAGYYVWSGTDLYVIDPTVPCGQDNVSLVGTNLIAGNITASTLSFDSGMATLWVLNDASPAILYEIDPSTGTVISSKPLQDCNGGGLNAVTEFASIAYDPVGDRFIGLNVNSPEVIYNFNPSDGCVFICATSIFLGLPNPPNLEADGLSVGPDGTFYVSGDVDDELGEKAIYAFMLPTCATFQLPPDSTVVATYATTNGDLGTVALNGTACLQECPIITCAISNIVDATCSDTTDGSATATPTGGTGPYSYIWSNGETTQTATMLTPGVPISVTITDANDCEVICDDFTISAPLELVCTINLEQAILCDGDNTGELSVSIDGGTFPYFISWSTGETTPTISGLAPGTYSVSITDDNECTTSCSFEIQPAPLFTCATMVINDVTCFGLGDGSANVVTFGGTGPFTYNWTSGEETQTAVALEAGLQSVTVTDANMCEAICDVGINQPLALECTVNLIANIECAEDINGSAEAIPTGGTSPYTYLWDNGETTAVAVMLDGGLHTVTVTDANMCTTECVITISDTSDLSCSVTIDQNVSCNGESDGSATVIATGGVPGYTYMWDNAETTQTAVALSAGFHEVTVTDQNNCATICTVTISEPVVLECSVVINADLMCFGENIGSASAVVTGGSGPFQFLWDDGQTTLTATGLDAGPVSVTITDANNCTTMCAGTIATPAELLCSVTPVSDISCFGEVDGSALAVPTGGVGPYTFLWSNSETTATATALPEGTNSVTVTDANMCETICTIDIVEPAELMCTVNKISDTLCEGESNGSAEAIPTGGTGPFTYLWDNGETTATSVMLGPGTRTVTVTDANDCITTCTVDIIGQSTLECTITQDNFIECFGDMDAALTANPTGGTAPYTYSWSTSETTQSITGVGPGDISVTVTDDNGCTNICMITVTEPTELMCDVSLEQGILCFGDMNGSATVTGTGGTPGYTYLWDNNEITATAVSLTVGIHTVTVTDANMCEAICMIDVPGPPELTCSTTLINNISCFGDDDGSATAVVVGGTPSFTFLWSTGETTATAIALVPGTNSVTVTDANMCETICTIDILEPEELFCSVTKLNDTLCEGESNGSAEAIPTGGTGPFTYLWDNGETTAVALMLDAGTHIVTVTDANNCVTNCTIDIAGQSTLACTVQQDNFIECFGDMDAALTAVPTGGNAPYTYVWSTTETTQTIMGLGPGDFSVTVTDDNGCTSICMITVTEPTEITCTISVNQGVACFGDTNGSATITGVGGTPGYTYLWDNNETTATAVALTAGAHQATITDVNGCMSICMVDIPGPPELTCSTTILNNITCFGDDDGSATVIVVGGTSGYTFQWSTGETAATAIALVPGVNSVTVTDANGCMTDCTVDIIEPPLLTCNVALVNNVLCAGESTGSATVVTNNGVAPFTFLWDNNETTATATMLSVGTHTVTVTDDTGCVTSCTIDIMDQTLLQCLVSLEQNVSCNGGNDGSGTVTVIGGVTPYTYEWDNMETTVTAVALIAGTNMVTVTDANGCFTVCEIIIIEPTALVCTIALENNISCFGEDDGSATVSATGGTPGYSFLWDDGQTEETAVGLTPGLHTVTVTDANLCESTCDIIIDEPDELTCSIATVNDISCFGANDGSATILPAGGTPAYTFLWDDGQTTATAIGLTPGPHAATVTDLNGCTTSCSITIIEPAEFTCDVILVNDVLCAGDVNGSATAVPTGGVAPFTYLWDNNETTATAAMLSGGGHVVTITDATNCTTTCEIVIMDQSTLECTATLIQDVSCNGGNDGSAIALAVGGVGPFSYIWDNGETTATATALDAGTHTVTVNDINNCGTTCTVLISEPLLLGCSVALINNITCFGDNDGSAIANPIGGTPAYTYLWDNGQTTQIATGLTPGSHIVTVTDMNLCETTCEIVIAEPVELLCSISLLNDISCFGENDGSAEVMTNGGTPEYTYIWDDGQTSSIGINLTPGNHTVTVTDSQGCTTMCSVNIFEPLEFTCTVDLVNNVLCEGEVNGSATAVTAGGISPFTYLWDNNETTATALMLASGPHSVTVTDATGCTTMCTVIIMDQSTLECTVTLVQNVSCNGDLDGAALVNPVGGVTPYTYEWSNLEITQSAVGLAAGLNTVTLTDANGCTTTCEIIITEPPILTCSVALENDISCFGFNDGSATVTAVGGTPDYTYLWDDNQTTATAVDLTPGLHTVTVTDANQCVTICEIIILEPAELTCTISLINDISCFGENDGTATITPLGGVPGYTYLWDDGQTTQTGINLMPGLREVTVTDVNACTTVCSITINEPAEFTCTVALVSDVLCAGDINGSATAVELGGIGPFVYLWDNNETTATAVMLSGGNHTVTITDATGCTTECSIEIMDQSTLQCTITLDQDVSCNGGIDGSATAEAIGGVGPFSYMWDNGESTATAVSLDAGTHTVTVNDINDCGTTCTIMIAEPPVYSCSISLENDISCFGADDGSATVTAIGGTPGYTYLWDNNQTGATATGLTPGLHTVTVTDANGCPTTCEIVINEPIELTCVIAVENDISCFGENDGSATITAMDGTPGYTYLWDDGQTTETAINLTPGLHSATVTDANACTTTCIITIAEPAEFTCTVTLVNDVFCAGDTNGSATGQPSGGIAPFSYLWDNNEVTATAVMLSGGNHTVTITDATGCTTVCSIEIMDQSTLECTVSLDQNVSCNGGTDGSATALAIGGVGPFTYIWDNGESTATAVGLDAGIHTVTVNDTNNCGTTCTIEITEPPVYSCSITFKTDISCFGENDGTAIVTAVGGTPGYTYLWSDGQTTANAVGLTPGLQSVTVTDSNGCETSCSITIDEPVELTCSIALVNDISCFGEDDGSATISATGGVSGYTYLWDDGQTTETAINLTPGLHTATVTDASLCTTVCSINIFEPLAFTCTVTLVNNVFCAGDINGSATAVETGGIGPFTYLWDNDEITATATMLSGGNHTVTITDATGCTTECAIEIMDQSTLECSVSLVSNVACNGGADGSATAAAVGGVGPFTYSWDNGESTETAVGLDAGIHTVTVNDTNNCGTTCTITITEPPVFSCSITVDNNISCFGANDGAATVLAIGGTPGYTYLWDDGQTTENAVGLSPGLHSVTVTDSNGCMTSCEVTIVEPIELACTIALVNDISCFGEDDGSATITATGGVPDYTYLWDDGQTTETAINLTPGPHTATVTDASLCTTVCSITINEPLEFICTVTLVNNVFCAGDLNGSATAVETGGIGPFAYLWDNGEITPTATMLSGGNHTVTITDATGCTTECAIEIMDQSTLECTVSLVSNVTCNGGADGSATATAVGGVGPFTYAWDNGESTETAVSLDAGIHTVTVNDTNNCGTTCTITIAEPPAYSCSITVDNDISCFGANDGAATVIAVGGTPGYTYLWDDGQTSENAVGLTPGLHSVTVTDANGCPTICDVTINEPIELTCTIALVNDISCFGEDDGSASIVVAGGTSDYTYLWDDGQTTETAINLTPGLHSATVTDANLCTTICSITINEPAEFTCSVEIISNVQCAGDTNGSASVTVTGGVGPFTYLWDNNETTQIATMLDGGNHTVIITDATGCMTQCAGIILDQSGLSCTIDVVNDISCFGANDGSATATATGGAGGYSYLWDNNETTQIATMLDGGNHIVIVTDATGCITQCAGIILDQSGLSCTIDVVNDISCFGADDGSATATATGGAGGYTYLWDNNETTQTATALSPGFHEVTVTDQNNCGTICNVSIVEPTLISLTEAITVTSLTCSGNDDGSATITVAGGTPPYAYLWPSGETSQTAIALGAGDGSVTVTDANQCTFIETYTIDAPEFPTISIMDITPVTCDNFFAGTSNDGSANADVTGGIPGYTYLWSSGETTAIATMLVTGINTVTVTDAFGCSTVQNVDIPVDNCFSIDLEKTVELVDPDALVQVGSQLLYSFKVCNNGTVALNIVTVDDPLITVTGNPIDLAPGLCDENNFTGIYTITQDDLDRRFVSNQATAMGFDIINNNPVSSNSDDPFTSAIDDPTVITLQAPAISLEKVADISALQDPPEPGDAIRYQFTVCNTGDLILSDINVIDPTINLTGIGLATLLPGTCDETSFEGNYVISSTDIALGFVENTALVTSTDPDDNVIDDRSDDPFDLENVDPNGDGNPDDPTIVLLEAVPQIELFKTGRVLSDCPSVGNLITYTFEVCNTGNIDLSGITVTDDIVTVMGGPLSLISGACNNTSFVASYALTQEDIDLGFVENTATTQGMDANGTIVSDVSDDPNDLSDVDIEGDGEADDVTETLIIQKGEIRLTKTGTFNDESGDGIAQLGETVSYSFVVENIGNVTLTDVLVNDPLVSVVGDAIAVLPVGGVDSLTFTGEYTLVNPDIEIALVDNTASVTANAPNGQVVDNTSDSRVEYIVRTCDEIICNNDLQVSLGASCELLLNEDQLIEDPVFGTYIISLFEDDEPFGVGGLLTEESIGKTLTYQVSCGLNSCWGTIIVEANKFPEFDSPCLPGADGEVDPDCIFACRNDERPSQIISEEEMTEILSSPCTPNLVGSLQVVETVEGDLCSENGTVVTIVYSGKFSVHDNVTDRHVLTQKYTIIPIPLDEIIFPTDITLNCNSSTDPSVIAAILQNNQFAYPTIFDQDFVPQPDSVLSCDSTQIEIILGTRDVMELQIIDGREVWTLVTVVDKRFDFEIDSSSCKMVVDPESFEEERYIPLDNRYCNLISSYSDTEFASCGTTKKILREWQVIDWCNPDNSQLSLQTIETIDNSAPVLLNLLDDVFVNIEPWSCTGVYNLPILRSGIHYFEFCGGPVEVTWDSEEGRIVDGALIDLWFTNDPIRVTATYTDECGNQNFDAFNIIMQDLTRPVMVCNTNMQVLLTGTNDNGSARLFAADLDEGSHDAGCGLVDLQIIRAEDYEDPVYNCEGEFIGFEPVTCGAQTEEVYVALTSGFEKDPDCADSLKTTVSLAGNYVRFCCEDVGQSVEVILIATDKHGNTNHCRVEVAIGEKLSPTLVCPTVEVDCSSDNMLLPAIEGSICAIQEYEPILIGEVNEATNCLNASFTREWYIDINANGELDSQDPYCQQTITIAGQGGVLDPYSIKWPKNYDGTTLEGINIECNDEGDPIENSAQITQGASMECVAEQSSTGPVWCHANCSLVGTSLETDTITSSEACLTIIKRWTVVDWCTWDSNQDDIDDENDQSADTFEAVEDWAQFNCDDCLHSNVWTDNVYFRYKTVDVDGYYTYDQVIRIEDQTGPEVLAPLEYIVSTSSGANTKDDEVACVGSDVITVKASDTCGGETANADDLSWTIIVSKDGEEIASKSAQGEEVTMNTQEGQPGDVHSILWIAQDACGNQTTITTVVTFGDESAPTPFCVTGLTSNLPDSNGDVAVWSNEFDFGSFDNCTSDEDLRFSIVLAGVDPVLPGEVGFENQNSILINCNDANQSTQLDMWVWDASGNGDFCTVQFTLSESCNEVQNGAGTTIAGKITTAYDENMADVEVTLSADVAEFPKTEQSNTNGQYAFFSNPEGFNYSIAPTKDGDDLNGVSTVDLVFIQRHIIGLSKLDSPYKVIASDANNDQNVSAADILELRKLILTYQDELSNSDSWRFVDKAQSFFDAESPWPFIEEVILTNLQDSRYGLDFMGVKIGDINYDANVNGFAKSETRFTAPPFQLEVEDQLVSNGDLITIDVTAKETTTLLGLQYTIEHKGFELIAIHSGALHIDQSNYASFNESTTFSWNTAGDAIALEESNALFSISLKAKTDSSLKGQLNLNSSRTPAEAYLKNINAVSPVELVFKSNNSIADFELYQNRPNPFDGETMISFTLPSAGKADISLYTIDGKVVKSLTGEFLKGYNEITIDRTQLPVSGVLYYQLQTEFGTKTKRMIVLD